MTFRTPVAVTRFGELRLAFALSGEFDLSSNITMLTAVATASNVRKDADDEDSLPRAIVAEY